MILGKWCKFAGITGTSRHRGDARPAIALDALGLDRKAILFAEFAGWDVAGAKWFGYPTYWVNRLDAPDEELGVTADATGRTLTDLASFVMSGG